MKYVLVLCALSFLIACGEEEETKTVVPQEEEVLTEVKDNVFTQYYPGKKKVKFRGSQDEAGERNGIWYFYDEKGTTISMTEYKHGKKNGVSLHRYPSGRTHYTGEYADNVEIGIWKTYSPEGKLIDSTNYTELIRKSK